MSEQVISLRGDRFQPANAPNPDVVGLLRRYMEAAERGEIDGVAIAASRPNERVATAWEYGEASFRLTAAVAGLFHSICDTVSYADSGTA